MESIKNIKLSDYKLVAREAILKVIGKKYRDMANSKLDKILFIEHIDVEGLKDYINSLKDAKSKQLFLRFFETIGFDVGIFKNIDSNSPYYEEYSELVRKFFGSLKAFEFNFIKFGIESFDKRYCDDSLSINNQILFLNGYLFNDEYIVTLDNYQEFKETSVYKNMEKKIFEWLDIFYELRDEFKTFLEEIKDVIDYEKNLESIINNEKKHNILRIYINNKIEFPNGTLKFLEEEYKTDEERAKILGYLDDEYFGFYVFSKECDDILKNGDKKEKERIIKKRLEYFNHVGYISVDLYDSSLDLYSLYDSVINRSDIDLYLPSKELVDTLATIKKSVIYKIKLDFLLERDEKFLSSLNEARISASAVYLAKYIIKFDCCQITPAYVVDRGNFILFFFMLKKGICGVVDYVYIHELLHILHVLFVDLQSFLGLDSDHTLNPYDSNFRINERFNETLVDLVALDTLKVLHDDIGIMMFEEEYVLLSPIDRNTSSIVKSVLYPFYRKYFDLIIEASMTANINLLKDALGAENLNSLIDLVNYIDKLARCNDLYTDIKNVNYDSLVYQDYLSKIEKVINVYEEMERYQNSKKKIL